MNLVRLGSERARAFVEHSRENTEILFADLGYKFSDQVENRFYLTLDATQSESAWRFDQVRNGKFAHAG